jgi:hypothetical protein
MKEGRPQALRLNSELQYYFSKGSIFATLLIYFPFLREEMCLYINRYVDRVLNLIYSTLSWTKRPQVNSLPHYYYYRYYIIIIIIKLSFCLVCLCCQRGG